MDFKAETDTKNMFQVTLLRKMKRLINLAVIIAVISMCNADELCGTGDKSVFGPDFRCANDSECQYFNESLNSVEIDCMNVTPSNCSVADWSVNRTIEQLRTHEENGIEHKFTIFNIQMRDCNASSIQKWIDFLPNLSSIDISYSNLESLIEFEFSKQHLIALNASHNRLTELPNWRTIAAIEITEMDLSFNKVARIESNAFDDAFELIKVHLSNNDIAYIADDAFTNLTNLEYVNLNNNQFHWVDMFRNNKMMKWLLVANNPILNFDCNHFLKMSSISVLISWEHVRYFHTNCDGNQFHIYLNSNHDDAVMPAQREIYCSDGSFESIQQFSAGRNKIESVAKMLQCFGPSLREMDLSGNFVGKLNTTTFKRFINLEWLSLSDTILVDFNFDMLANQTKLERLDMSFNNLKSVSDASMLKQFGNLSQFIAAGSQLPNASEIIRHLRPSIGYLDLSGNFFGQVNAVSFQRLSHLHTFKLNNTHLLVLNSNPFEPLTSLRSLDISQNNLKNVNFSMMARTLQALNDFSAADCHISNASAVIQYLGPSITDLNLSGNTLNELNLNTFKVLINLRNLYLSNVHIFRFDSMVLRHQTQLRFLNISYNQLNMVDLGALSKSLVKLDLEGNGLIEVINFNRQRFSLLESLAISKNRIPCNYVMNLIRNWDVLKFIGNPMDQMHGECLQNLPIDDSAIELVREESEKNFLNELRDFSPILMHLAIIVVPIIIILMVGCTCFVIQRLLLQHENQSKADNITYIQNEFDKCIEERTSEPEHIYEELDSYIVYDRLRYDTDPMPLTATKSHYHNINMTNRTRTDFPNNKLHKIDEE